MPNAGSDVLGQPKPPFTRRELTRGGCYGVENTVGPAIAIIDRLWAQGASIRAFDPAVAGPLEGIDVVSDPYAACDGADVLVVLTVWPLFAELDLVKARELMTSARLVDGRNMFNPAYAGMLGFAYEGIGRRGWIDVSELDTLDVSE